MKKLLFILVLFSITHSSNIAYSQVLKLDSLIEMNSDIEYTQKFVVYSSILNNSDSIIEKGVLLTYPGTIPLYGYPGGDSIFMPIYNNSFDTSIYFYYDYGYVRIQSYIKTSMNIIYSDSIAKAQLIGVGLNDISKRELKVKIYPTIVNDILRIETQNNDIKELEVIDVLGRVVKRESIYNNKQVNCSQLKAGIYNCIITTKDNKRVAKKFIKQ